MNARINDYGARGLKRAVRKQLLKLVESNESKSMSVIKRPWRINE